MYANIIVDITHEKLDRVFEYLVPTQLESILKVGMEVLVPFGNGNRKTKGYVTGLAQTCKYEAGKVKSILGIPPKSMAIETTLVALAAWMREHYGGTMIQSLKTVLPIKQKENEKIQKKVRLLLEEAPGKEKLDWFLHKNQKARARLLAALLDEPVLDYEKVTKQLNIAKPVIQALETQGILKVESQSVYRNPVKTQEQKENLFDYTKEQIEAVEDFWTDYNQGIRKTYLLYGVTGSGKTEVYMEMIGRVIKEGRQAIVLIPEIALTYQTVMRFYQRFGDRVSIINSRLSAGERYDQMMRAKNGEIDVMIGPRSALFTPFRKLGLIVVDEEHESTYKSEQVPRYHARETAEERAKLENASVVLGSATPSLESYYRAKKGTYELLRLQNRTGQQTMATVYTVDLREEMRNGNRSIISDRLRELMEDRFLKKQQMMLFLNRRGYAGFVSCRACGYVAKCPHCDVALSYHQNGKLVCHYCGYETPQITVCPTCGSKHVGGFRAGTQQIEELVKKEFPQARVLRMDMDTTKAKDGHEKILSAFAKGEADVLVGTQMIVKGHDFPHVTLVGILAADLSLYADDYRAGERTFQLLTQAAGRAGRGNEKGEVVIQTYSPDHYSIQTAAHQDYESFYEEEMKYRELMGYPPVEQLMAVLLSSREEALLDTAAGYLKEFAVRADKAKEMQIIGPTSPYVGKINDIYRRIIYFKQEKEGPLIEMKEHLEQYIEMNSGFRNLWVQFDFNPMSMF
ncbi:MAG: primosomal protein N' [Lachnospiraceae bacterium]